VHVPERREQILAPPVDAGHPGGHRHVTPDGADAPALHQHRLAGNGRPGTHIDDRHAGDRHRAASSHGVEPFLRPEHAEGKDRGKCDQREEKNPERAPYVCHGKYGGHSRSTRVKEK
jgi:hypothetical protein